MFTKLDRANRMCSTLLRAAPHVPCCSEQTACVPRCSEPAPESPGALFNSAPALRPPPRQGLASCGHKRGRVCANSGEGPQSRTAQQDPMSAKGAGFRFLGWGPPTAAVTAAVRAIRTCRCGTAREPGVCPPPGNRGSARHPGTGGLPATQEPGVCPPPRVTAQNHAGVPAAQHRGPCRAARVAIQCTAWYGALQRSRLASTGPSTPLSPPHAPPMQAVPSPWQ